MTTALTIVVPTRNEAETLPALLTHLRPFRDRGCEIIVVDGGSDDGSATLVRLAGFSCFSSSPGRAVQMNAGADQARGDVLLFLHADTQLPQSAEQLVLDALQRSGRDWGHFDLRIQGRSRMLPVVSWAINRRSRWTGIATGDQALFVRRSLFERVGRFPFQPLMEDVELCKKLGRRGRPVCIDGPVTTSGRRWDRKGVWPTVLLMWQLRLAYWLGIPADRLARLYQ